MTTNERTGPAIFWSALLHLGLAGFLLASTISCDKWEGAFAWLPLPKAWNPVTCTQPEPPSGPIMQAELVNQATAPSADTTEKSPQESTPKAMDEKIDTTPAKPSKPDAEREDIDTLPEPPDEPDLKTQEKVVAEAKDEAKQAEKAQKEKQKQRMSEMNAKDSSELDKILNQYNKARSERKKAEKRSEQLARADTVASPSADRAESADQASSGAEGTQDDAYRAAIQSAVTQAWRHHGNIPKDKVCDVHIKQIPPGEVVGVQVQPDCPFDAAARRSVEDAVHRASPLPYKGYEQAFRKYGGDMTLHFKVED